MYVYLNYFAVYLKHCKSTILQKKLKIDKNKKMKFGVIRQCIKTNTDEAH